MENLLSQGAQLAVFGMGTVFVFLIFLIFFIKLMSFAVLRLDSSNALDDGVESKIAMNDGMLTEDRERLVAVISAAIKHYKSRN